MIDRRLASAAGLACTLLAIGPGATQASAAATPLDTSWAPAVVTGADLGVPLEGVPPGKLVAFRWTSRKWRQIPIQVDQRLEVDFGTTSLSGPGSAGTVYGSPPVGTTALQYADPNTFVGADTDPALDGNDEVAVMAADAGGKAPARASRPKHVARRSAETVRLIDPTDGGKAFVYLFRSDGSLDPAAGRDYVNYDFNLASGDYRTTYRRAQGPNPETSKVATGSYVAGFSDRWMYDSLAIKAGGASRVDVLDGLKFGFAPGNCGRSEATFDAGEGAFVANIDGPVRAIRSYVGANSGPYAERTHFFYRRAHQIVTDVRVHPITGLWIYHDLAAPAIGMTYRDSGAESGVTVDGSPDPGVGGPVADWHLWSGPQGSLFSGDRFASTFQDQLLTGASGWYLDDSTPAYQQCWGDSQALGQAGFLTPASIPNTDPSSGGTDRLRATTTEVLAGPGTTTTDARHWSATLDSPILAHVTAG